MSFKTQAIKSEIDAVKDGMLARGKKQKKTTGGSQLHPDDFKDLAALARLHIELGVANIEEFSEYIRKEFGERYVKAARQVWQETYGVERTEPIESDCTEPENETLRKPVRASAIRKKRQPESPVQQRIDVDERVTGEPKEVSSGKELHVDSHKLQNSEMLGVAFSGLLLMAVHFWILFGEVPYTFFPIFKWGGLAICLVISISLFRVAKMFLPLIFALLGLASFHSIGVQRREEWIPYHWASIITLAVAIVTLLTIRGYRRKCGADVHSSTVENDGSSIALLSNKVTTFLKLLVFFPMILGGTIASLTVPLKAEPRFYAYCNARSQIDSKFQSYVKIVDDANQKLVLQDDDASTDENFLDTKRIEFLGTSVAEEINLVISDFESLKSQISLIETPENYTNDIRAIEQTCNEALSNCKRFGENLQIYLNRRDSQSLDDLESAALKCRNIGYALPGLNTKEVKWDGRLARIANSSPQWDYSFMDYLSTYGGAIIPVALLVYPGAIFFMLIAGSTDEIERFFWWKFESTSDKVSSILWELGRFAVSFFVLMIFGNFASAYVNHAATQSSPEFRGLPALTFSVLSIAYAVFFLRNEEDFDPIPLIGSSFGFALGFTLPIVQKAMN